MTKGNPNKGFGIGFGLFPDADNSMKLTLDFNYMLPTKDWVVAEVENNSCPSCNSGLTDKVAVKTRLRSLGLNYAYSFPHNLTSLLYFTGGLGWHSGKYTLEYSYSNPDKYLDIPNEITWRFLDVSAEVAAYYDLENFYLFASTKVNYNLFHENDNDDTHLAPITPINFGLSIGICYFLN